MDNRAERMYELMKNESNRLRTFQMNPPWPKDFVDIKKLAKAGFFYAFNDDDVHCAFCRGQVRQWNRDDDPMTEHARHFTTCPFIMGGEVGNEPLGDDPFPGAKRPRPYDVCGMHPNFPPNDSRSLDEQQTIVETDEDSSESSLEQTSTEEQVSVDEEEEQQQQQQQHSQSLLGELAQFNYNYQNARGQQQAALEQQRRRLYVPPAPPNQKSTQDPLTIPQNNPNTKSNSSDNLTGICKICYTNSIELVFLPCGHSVSCLSCAEQLVSCPCCRSSITTRIRTFLV